MEGSQFTLKRFFIIVVFALSAPIFGRAQCTGPVNDCDGDGILDNVDLDDDNDGILDTDERVVLSSSGGTFPDGSTYTVSGALLIHGEGQIEVINLAQMLVHGTLPIIYPQT